MFPPLGSRHRQFYFFWSVGDRRRKYSSLGYLHTVCVPTIKIVMERLALSSVLDLSYSSLVSYVNYG
jgi:hypothetical protein